MKNLSLMILMLISLNNFAQTNKHRSNIMSNYAFQQVIANLNAKPDDAQKLMLAKNVANDNRLLSDQVKKIAELFGNDNTRLEFAESAYENTVDKENFYEVYNAFAYFSSVFRLHDFIHDQKGGTNEVVEIPVNNVMTFPDIDYPDYRKYFGKIGCTNIITDQNFTPLAEKVFKETTEDRKLALANNIAYANCLQTAQVMKIASLLQTEQSRMDFMKKARQKVFDPDNYKYAMPLFTTDSYKQELTALMGGQVLEVSNNTPACEVSQKDFTDIKNQISKQSFINTKVNIAKQNLKDKKCFKTEQIIELLSLFPYSDTKMDIAKYAYDYTTDQGNYVKVADAFSFSSDKNKFLEFLKTKK